MEEQERSQDGEQGEAVFVEWVEEESRRREVRRLEERLEQLEKVQVLGYFLILFWIIAIFVGYQLRPDWMPAGVAGLVTTFIMFGGAFVVLQVVRLKRETQRRLRIVAGTEEQASVREEER
jgi:hypothetical protein